MNFWPGARAPASRRSGAEPDPIRRRRGEPANNPGAERKLPESRTWIERLGERRREQRVRVGDVEHTVAAHGEAAGMAARARHVYISGWAARLEIDADHRHGPRRTPKLSLR